MHTYKRTIKRVVLFFLTIFIIILVFPKEGSFWYEFSEGKPWRHNDLIAPFDFAIKKAEAVLKKERNEIISTQPLYFRLDKKTGVQSKEKFRKLIEDDKKPLLFINRNRKALLTVGLRLLDTIYNHGYLEEKTVPDRFSESEKAIIIDGNIAREVPFTSIVTVSDIPELIIERLRNNPEIDSTLFVRSIYRSLQHNLFFDSVLTDNDLIDRLSVIVPVNGLIQQDERIITKGEIVDGEKYQVLLSLKAEYEDQLKGSTYYYGILAGQIILVTIALLAMVLFLIFFRKDVWRSYKKIVLINCIILLMVGITAITVRTHVDWIYLVPLCLAPIIIRVFFDTGMAIFVHIITVILIGFLVPNSFEYVFFQLIAGIITIVSVRDLQKRSQFFMTSLFIFLTYIFLMIGFTLIQHGSLAEINSLNLAMFGGSALLTLFAYPFIFIIEKGFNMTTDISLLEYADTNSKLLRRLANEAPGTFQHAIQVANLAEEAIRYIGGNALLTRAGALYHDIGKLYNPAYFTENQTVGNNPHDKLSYKESVNILRNHVTKGISMAKKHKLPVQIIDFIKTHHGTKKADYFFLKYKEDHPGDTIDESEFRYPGPEPFSKETAVVMMADAVEAASRSMKQPDKKQIDSLVENLIDKQLAENQYSFSAITLGEISKVKAIFKKRLMNIYHLRVEYPDEKKEK